MNCKEEGLSKLRRLQLIEADALSELKKICDKEGIRFFLRGGSVMGAVKYGGFVPWDDDMDIAVPREDYERLIEKFQNKIIANKYIITSYRSNSDMHCYFPRLFLKEDVRKQEGLPKDNVLGLHLIDILPLDGAPENIVLRHIYFLKVYCLRMLGSLGTATTDAVGMHNKKQEMVINILKSMKLNKLFSQKSIYLKLEKIYTKYNWKTSRYSGTITGSLIRKEVMPSYIWGMGVMKIFENEKYVVPTEYDKYLKRLYGYNYMNEEPNPEKRKSHLGKNRLS